MASAPDAGAADKQEAHAQRASATSETHTDSKRTPSHRRPISERLAPNLLSTSNTSTASAIAETAARGRNERPAAPTLRQLQMNDPQTSRTRSVDAQTTASRSSLSTQPVVVHTYSRSRDRDRDTSRDTSRQQAEQTPKVHDQTMPQTQSNTMTLTTPNSPAKSSSLPSIEEFKFSLILQAVEPDIHSAIDAIAEICARSRLSLADEYTAHLPPFTHSLPPMPRTRPPSHGMRGEGRRLALSTGQALTTVPETSSSSEHSSPSTTSGSGRTKISAYGSLAKVLTRHGRKGSSSATGEGEVKRIHGRDGSTGTGAGAGYVPPTLLAWQGKGLARPLIIRVATPKLSDEVAAKPAVLHNSDDADREDTQTGSVCRSRPRSWFPWTSNSISANAEGRLKDLLKTAKPKPDAVDPLPG